MKKKRLLSVFLAAALSLSLFNAPLPASQAEGSTTGELKGKPWVTSVMQGNLPEERPDVKDDLYTYYTYDFLEAHQDTPCIASDVYAGEMKESILKVLSDSSKTGHDLEQMRIFFNQALDTETLKEVGLSQVQPYLDRIEAVTSIEEMNSLLTASDFPFSPFLVPVIAAKDKRDINIVAVFPNLLFMDPLFDGGRYYQDSEDPNKQEMIENARYNKSFNALLDLYAQGISKEEVDEVYEAYERMMAFEKQYAKYLDYSGKYAGTEYGIYAKAMASGYFTFDELCAECPHFPMKEMLNKLGMENSKEYNAEEAYVKAFNELWIDENIEVIKEIATLKVLNETRPYRDQTGINMLYEYIGWDVPDAGTSAYNACNSIDTFAIVLAETYVKEVLGTKAIDRLTNLTEALIKSFKELVRDTSWLSEKSRTNIFEKLDHMTINMLEPAGGYYDFSGLDLVPTKEGGTLFDNYLRLKQYRLDQESMMVGKRATGAFLWNSIAPTVENAYYDSSSNSINICPGYVNSLYYTDDMSETELLAGIGFTIGHEISHGFDYTGSQFNAYGVPTPIFTDDDVDDFVRKNSILAEYYSSIEVTPDLMVNGENCIGEAAADLSGLQTVLEIAGKNEEIEYEGLFELFAKKWAAVYYEGAMGELLLNEHPLGNLRINVSSQMFEPMYETFDIDEGDGMYLAPEKRINIWGDAATDPAKLTIFRMYNSNSGEHFFTGDEKEQNALISVGWNNEGEGWIAPASSDTPVYRLYNINSGGHHYTANAVERDQLISIGWSDEGISWYSDDKNTEPLYRLYNPNASGQYEAGAHHYTSDAAERDILVGLGWNDEGIGWYGL